MASLLDLMLARQNPTAGLLSQLQGGPGPVPQPQAAPVPQPTPGVVRQPGGPVMPAPPPLPAPAPPAMQQGLPAPQAPQPEQQADEPQQGGSFFTQLFAGKPVAGLSQEQNRALRKNALLTAGLTILGRQDVNPLQGLAIGVLAARQATAQTAGELLDEQNLQRRIAERADIIGQDLEPLEMYEQLRRLASKEGDLDQVKALTQVIEELNDTNAEELRRNLDERTIRVAERRADFEMGPQFEEEKRQFNTQLAMRQQELNARMAELAQANQGEAAAELRALDSRYQANPIVKDSNTVAQSVGRVFAAAEDASAAGDLALIFNYMKVLDPGSVVRESEFATAENAGSVPERIRAQYNKVLQGERLSEEIRADFVDRAGRLAREQQKQLETVNSRWSQIATDAGADPSLIIYDPFEVALRERGPTEQQQAPAWQQRARDLRAQGLSQDEIVARLRQEGLIR